MGSISSALEITEPSGLLNQVTSNSSWVVPTIEQLTFIMSLWCLRLVDTVGLINISSDNIATDLSHQMGTIYYPPLVPTSKDVDLSFLAPFMMNSFNVSMGYISSIPSTTQNLSTCGHSSIFTGGEVWYNGSDNQTLSIIFVNIVILNFLWINATMIIMGGTLSAIDNYTEFALNRTSWHNVMSAGNQWAEDTANIICNTTLPPFVGNCPLGSSLFDFATQLLGNSFYPDDAFWSTVLNMAIGAYSSAMFSSGTVVHRTPNSTSGRWITVPVTWYGVQFTLIYGTYILLLNIVASLVMLVIVVRLRLANHLGPDFINSTRLLLDPLKKPELFNASPQTTVDALSDPYMLVGNNTFMLVKLRSKPERKIWFERFAWRRRNRTTTKFCDDATSEET